MRFVKGIALIAVMSLTLDAVVWDGVYRRALGRGIEGAATSVAASKWLGLDEV